MDLENRQHLINKYWKGETTPLEEQELRAILAKDQLSKEEELETMFKKIDQFSNLSLGKEFGDQFMRDVVRSETRIVSLWRRLGSIAAAILFVIGVGVVVNQYTQPSQPASLAAEEDPEKAYQLATEALMLISSKLNSASEYTNELDRFNEVAKKISQEENNIQNQN